MNIKTLIFHACMLAVWTTALSALCQAPTGDIVLTEDGRVIGGTALATKTDLADLATKTDLTGLATKDDLADLEKEIVSLKTWGLAIGFLVTLAAPALTAYIMQRRERFRRSATPQAAEAFE